MNHQAILNRLSAEAGSLRQQFGVKDMAVFGSVALGLALHLTELFQRKIDLITLKSLSARPDIKAEIEKDLVHLP